MRMLPGRDHINMRNSMLLWRDQINMFLWRDQINMLVWHDPGRDHINMLSMALTQQHAFMA